MVLIVNVGIAAQCIHDTLLSLLLSLQVDPQLRCLLMAWLLMLRFYLFDLSLLSLFFVTILITHSSARTYSAVAPKNLYFSFFFTSSIMLGVLGYALQASLAEEEALAGL